MPRIESPYLEILGDLLKKGDVRRVREQLGRVALRKVPRRDVVALAGIARRAQLPEMAAELLGPYVREGAKAPASVREQAEYAEALNKIGANDEALARLKRLDARDAPEVALYLASTYIGRWDYESSIAPLKHYVELCRDPYLAFVARLNLAVAYCDTEKYETAERLLAKLRNEAKHASWLRLYGNSLHASAANAVSAGRYPEAAVFLADARKCLGERAGTESLLVDKWSALLVLRREGATPVALEKLEATRRRARRLRHWETLRDCDRHEALVRGDRDLAARVFHGTPFPAFRAKLEAAFGPIAPSYDWALFRRPGVGTVLAPEEGIIGLETRAAFRPGKVSLRLLFALSADLYRPARVGALHARTFPEAAFNPRSSPARVHQAVSRLRSDLENERIPLTVLEQHGEYSLRATAPFTIRLGKTPTDRQDAHLFDLEKTWGTEYFDVPSAAKRLGLHPRVLQRALARAIDEGRIERRGAGSATRYRFVAAARRRPA